MAQGRGEIKDLLERHGIKPKRSLGQNFLGDPNLVDRIVRTAALDPGDQVVEVGAGTGTLTKALAATGARVVAYEVDPRLMPVLEVVLADTDVEVRNQDVSKVDLGETLGDGSWTMVANLPYNVGTPLVLEVLRHVPEVTDLVVMVQREVADRLVADPGAKAYGLPSIITRLNGEARLAFTVPPNVFFPVPEVESAVVKIERIAADPLAEEAIALAAIAFQQRRKMLRRSLAEALPDAASACRAAGFVETARPEELTAADFISLAEVTR